MREHCSKLSLRRSHNLCLGAKVRKCKPQFDYVKLGYNRVYIFVMWPTRLGKMSMIWVMEIWNSVKDGQEIVLGTVSVFVFLINNRHLFVLKSLIHPYRMSNTCTNKGAA